MHFQSVLIMHFSINYALPIIIQIYNYLSFCSFPGKDDREAIIVISDEDFSVMKAGKKGKKKSWKRKAPLSATPTVEKKRAIDEEEGEIIVVSSGSEVEGGVGSGHQSGSSEGGSEAMDLGNESDPDKSVCMQ